MAGLRTCSRVLVDRLATAHRPTVPPSGERTVIIAISVALATHISRACLLADIDRLGSRRPTVKRQACGVPLTTPSSTFLNTFKNFLTGRKVRRIVQKLN